MDVELQLDLTGTETMFLNTTTNFIATLGELESYKSAPGDLAHEQMTSHLGQYHGYFVAGKNGDRVNIALRKGSRQALTLRCKKALYFLQAVATEDDLPKLLQGGVKIRQRPRRRPNAKAPQQ